jgi:hypothetical protein
MGRTLLQSLARWYLLVSLFPILMLFHGWLLWVGIRMIVFCGIHVEHPLLLLTYINDMPEMVKSSETKLFADDSLLFRTINNQADSVLLQSILHCWSHHGCICCWFHWFGAVF